MCKIFLFFNQQKDLVKMQMPFGYDHNSLIHSSITSEYNILLYFDYPFAESWIFKFRWKWECAYTCLPGVL